ncbi:hypothetical protein [Nocardiopsis sp. CC223A]|uniref:hypothetical protein n=1 Tax=Nocardiopsis sp. CC223A TaxID=3044051 RepID=UPI00278C4BC4|nr:hypothetical protein [Nocardiopsis sp. CC223A]
MRQFMGILIGAGFGLAFVLANAGPPLPSAVGMVLRVLAVAALVATVVLSGALSRRPAPPAAEAGPAPAFRFGPFYGVVVLVEVVLIFGGVQVLRLSEAPWQANVAWIALVVGLHFLPLAWYWRMREILAAALYISAMGAVGLVMVAVGAAEWAPFVSGVLTGLGILAGILVSLVVMLRASRDAVGHTPGTAPLR